MSKHLQWWNKLSYEERKDCIDENNLSSAAATNCIIESDIEKLYNMTQEKDRKNDPFLRHEVLDRATLLCDILAEKILSNEFFEYHPELKNEGEDLLSDLYEFTTKLAG